MILQGIGLTTLPNYRYLTRSVIRRPGSNYT